MKNISQNYSLTRRACYTGYVTQAVVNNLAPLLFVMFRSSFGLSLGKISTLIGLNFAVQMTIDFLSAGFVDRIGVRRSIVAAHILCASGLVMMGTLPFVTDSFFGLALSVIFYAVGGGLIEVLISPILESLPSGDKAAGMSLLHSFYCWGHAAVVIITTVYLNFSGEWRLLPLLWAAVPALNAAVFAVCPLLPFAGGEKALPLRKLFGMKIFILFLLLMMCAGASELAVSQWSSYFAQSSLGVSKTVGDLLGTLMFALLMGTARALFSRCSGKFPVGRYICASSILCFFGYMMIVFAPHPAVALAGCGVCGFSVGVMWPGIFSLALEKIPAGGTAMFAMFALAGDIGCGGGPVLVGRTAQFFGGKLEWGFLAAAVFPAVLAAGSGALSAKADSDKK